MQILPLPPGKFGQWQERVWESCTSSFTLDGTSGHRYLPSFFSISNQQGIPYVAIISVAIVSFGKHLIACPNHVVLTSLEYNFLIQIYLVLRLVIVFSEYGSLIYLKWKEPDTPRPYSVPGGTSWFFVFRTLQERQAQ
jgi:amino acid transporter